jgi:tetratricopeptide (TPR) repeat protein
MSQQHMVQIMQNIQVNHRPLYWVGSVLQVLGFFGDIAIGMLLLLEANLQLFLLHLPFVFIWAWGVNIIENQGLQDEQPAHIGLIYVNGWGVAALLLGLCAFPGLGPLAFSVALSIASFMRQRTTIEMPDETAPTLEISKALDLEIQPMVDVLHNSDLETRRAAVAALGRHANPGSIGLLRQLLSDPRAEIRSDASIALTRIESEFSCALNASVKQWIADPADSESALTLADRYYQYACSNVLDEVSRHVYLVKARNLVEQVISQDSMEAELWMQLARIRQHLGETGNALQDARTALQLQPDSQEAYLLAMELAFCLHAWDTLISLASEGLTELPEDSETQTSLQWWATLSPEPGRQGGGSLG